MKDNFSKQASTYARYRPHYPAELYDYIFSRCTKYGNAWDCGTGNGQVAVQLAKRFDYVNATDISQAQLNNALKKTSIEYRLASAETSGLPAGSIDLITVAQAIHWFDPKKFFDEVKRVATSNCLLTYWAYDLPRINEDIDETVRYVHDKILGSYWDLERGYWRNKYADIQFPLKRLEKKNFVYKAEWEHEDLEGYLNSWSALQHYIAKNQENPISEHLKPLKTSWKSPKKVEFPIFLYAGVVESSGW